MMKTRLLKKIRKQYSIVYYPNEKRYEIKHPNDDDYFFISQLIDSGLKIKNNKTYNQAIDNLLVIIRKDYYKYTRKHKLSMVNYKVWYNG